MATLARSWTAKRKLSVSAHSRAFSRLRLSEGISKTTAAGRLADLDAAAVALLPRHRFSINIMDAGASSGVTSLELLEAVVTAGYPATMTLTDRSLCARRLRLGFGFGALVDSRGYVLQHIVAGLPLRTWRRRLDYFTQFWLVVWAANRWHERLRVTGAVRHAEGLAEPVLLVDPRVASHPAIRCEEADVLAPPAQHERSSFDVVRAANLLMPEIFTPDQLRLAIGNLKARLRGPGSLLILARSPPPGQPGGNHATIYRLAADGSLRAASRLGDGSELEALLGTNSSSLP